MVSSMFDDLLDHQSDTDKVRLTLKPVGLDLIGNRLKGRIRSTH